MSTQSSGVKRTLGLTGVTVNAMALLAPGAFLWVTYQMQAAARDANGVSSAPDMWTGIVVALTAVFLSAFAFTELLRRHPESASGSAYYFAQKTFLDKRQSTRPQSVRAIKFVTGWAAHLFYWGYPGVMVAFMTTLITYLFGQFGINLPVIGQIGVAILFAVAVGTIALRGISGSTTTSIMINVIQITTLVLFSALAIHFRNTNPLSLQPSEWFHADAGSILLPHSLTGMLFQAAIAILILVGFESSSGFAAEALQPRRDIPRAVILSLIIQGVFAYLFQYFAANYALGEWLGTGGLNAAAASGAPIGDMAIRIGDALLENNGFALMIILASSVAIAILGTTLASFNTGVRIGFAMAQDRHMPEILGALPTRYATPYTGVIVMVIVSALIGSIGVVGGVVTLTGITLASNLGTFILYTLICASTFTAYRGTAQFNRLRHAILPAAGMILNAILVLVILVTALSGGTSAESSLIAAAIAAAWLVICVLALVFNPLNRRVKGKA